MKQVLIEVLEGGNLLKKSNRAAVWLKSLIGPVEMEKLGPLKVSYEIYQAIKKNPKAEQL